MFQNLNFAGRKLDVPYLEEDYAFPQASRASEHMNYPAFMPDGCKTLKDMMDRIIDITASSEEPNLPMLLDHPTA